LPVTTIAYSHFHVDHVGDGTVLGGRGAKSWSELRMMASKATADKVAFMKSRLPKPSFVLPRLKDSFKFEKLTVKLHRFAKLAHIDDHSA
jgi:glyoxylase-like metal-dependent hydrolase (beta-lactamase superfamily II)